MLKSDGKINFLVTFTTDQQSINSIQSSLEKLKNIKPADFSGTTKDLKEIQKAAGDVEKALSKAFNNKLQSFNTLTFQKELLNTGYTIDTVYRKFSLAGAQGKVAFNQIATSVLTTNLKLKETTSLVSKIGTTLINSLKWNIASSFINNISGSIQSAFKYTESLLRSLTNIRIVTGDSTDKMSKFADQANRAANELGRSTLDYTKAALTYYQQGLSDEDVQARTEATLKAQNITGAGSEMADYLTSVWNGYKVANEEAELYVDKLAAVADTSASDMSELAIAMSKVASTANTMGVDIDQLNAQIATVVATTRQAPESVGTAFKTIYTRLNDIKTGADEAEISLGNYSGKMANLGFNVLDQNGHLRDTGLIMEEIGSKWETLTRLQQIYLATTMGGQRQVNQLMALFGNWTTYSELLNTSLESQGTLAEKNARYMESLGAKMEQLGAAGERVKRALINADDMKGLVGMLGSATNLIANFFESFGSGTTVLLSFGGLFTQLFSGTIAKEINNAIVHFQNLKFNAEKTAQDIMNANRASLSAAYGDESNSAFKEIVDYKLQVQAIDSVLSDKEKNILNEQLKQIETLQSKILILQEQVQTVQAFLKAIRSALSIEEGRKVTLQEFGNQLARSQEKAEEILKTLKTISSTSLRDAFNSGDGQEYLSIIKNLMELLQKITGNKAVPAMKQFDSALKKIEKEGLNNVGSLELLIKYLKQAAEQVNNFHTDSWDTLILNSRIQDTTKSVSALKNQFEEVLASGLQQFNVQQWTNLAGGIARAAGALQSFSNIPKIFKNENLTDGEKFLQLISTLSFSVPSLIASFRSLEGVLGLTALKQKAATLEALANKTAILAQTAKQQFQSLVTKKQLKEKVTLTLILKAATAAKDADTLATNVNTAATEAATAANEAFIATLAPIAVVAVSIVALVAAYDALTVSTKLAKKALEESTEKYNLATSNLESSKNQLESIQKRLKLLKEIGAPTLALQEEILKLLQENILLTEQVRLQEQLAKEAAKKQAKATHQAIESGVYKSDSASGTGLAKGLSRESRQQNLDGDTDSANAIYYKSQLSQVQQRYNELGYEGLLVNNDEITSEVYNDILQSYLKDIDNLNKQIEDASSETEKKTLESQQKNVQALYDAVNANFNTYLDDLSAQLPEVKQRINEYLLLSLEEMTETNQQDLSYLQNLVMQYYIGKGNLDSTLANVFTSFKEITPDIWKKFYNSLNEYDGEDGEGFLKEKFGDKLGLALTDTIEKLGLSIDEGLKYIQENPNEIDWSNVLNVPELLDEKNKILAAFSDIGALSTTGLKLTSGKNVGIKERQDFSDRASGIATIAESQGNTEIALAAKYLTNTAAALTEEYAQALLKVLGYLALLANKKIEALGIDALSDEEKQSLENYCDSLERYRQLVGEGNENSLLFSIALQKEAEKYGTTTSAVKLYAKILKESNKVKKTYYDTAKKEIEQLELTSLEYEEVAINNLALKDSLEKIQKIGSIDIKLRTGSTEDQKTFAEQITEVVNALNEIPGMSIDTSQAVLHLDLINQVATGDVDSLYKLKQVLAEEYIAKVKTLADIDLSYLLTQINNTIQDLSPELIRVGAFLDDTNFMQNLAALASKSEAMAQYVYSLLSQLGAEPYIVGWENIAFSSPVVSTGKGTGRTSLTDAARGEAAALTGENQKMEMQAGSFPMPVIGYRMKNSPEKPDVSPSGSKGGGGGGGGGGSEKDPKKELLIKNELDSYHDINRLISKLEKQFDKLSDAQKRAAGLEAVDLLNEEIDLIGKQIGQYELKIDLIDKLNAELRKTAEDAGYNAIFDAETGLIANYRELYESELNKVNSVIEKYNAMTAAEQELHAEELKQAKLNWENFKKWLSDYDANIDLKELTVEAIKSQLEKQLEINIDKFKMKVDIDLDLAEAARDWNEFLRKVIDKLDENDVSKRAKSMLKDLSTYYNDETGAIPSLTDHINNTMEQIERLQDGIDGAYGVFKDGVSAEDLNQALEDLDKYTEDLMSNLEAVEDLIQEVRQAYFDMLDAAQEAFDKQNEEYEFITKMLDHDKNLIDMLYGEKAFDRFDELYKQRDKNNRQQLDFLKQQKDLYWNEVLAMKAARDGVEEGSEAWKQYNKYLEAAEEKWKSAVEDFNSQVENSIQNLLDQYNNTLSKIFDDLDKKLTNGHGGEYLSEEWELIKANAEQYLDPIEAAFDLSDLDNAFEDALKNTQNNIKAQKTLTDLRDKELKKLKEKDKLTKFDIERAQALLDIELKRIALELSKNNTSKLRLRRDSQGNYSYQYVADESVTQQALKDLTDSQRKFFELMRDQDLATTDNYLNAVKNAQKISEYLTNSNLSDLQRENLTKLQKQLLQSAALQRQDFKKTTEEDGQILAEFYGTSADDFVKMTETQKESFMSDFFPGFKTGINQITLNITGPGGLMESFDQSMLKIKTETNNYKVSLEELTKVAELDFNKVGEAINDNITKTETLLDSNDKLIGSYLAEIETVKDVIGQVEDLAKSYNGMRDAAILAAEAAKQMYENIKRAQAAAAQLAVDADDWGVHGSEKPSKIQGREVEWLSLGEGLNIRWKVKDKNTGEYLTGSLKDLEYTTLSGDRYLADYETDSLGYIKSNGHSSHDGYYGAKNIRHLNATTSTNDTDDTENENDSDTLSTGNNLVFDSLAKDYSEGLGEGNNYRGSWNKSKKRTSSLKKEVTSNPNNNNITNTSDSFDSNTIEKINETVKNSITQKAIASNPAKNIPSYELLKLFKVPSWENSSNGLPSLNQQVTINANFPNATNAKLFENISTSLLNQAAQYAYRGFKRPH